MNLDCFGCHEIIRHILPYFFCHFDRQWTQAARLLKQLDFDLFYNRYLFTFRFSNKSATCSQMFENGAVLCITL